MQTMRALYSCSEITLKKKRLVDYGQQPSRLTSLGSNHAEHHQTFPRMSLVLASNRNGDHKSQPALQWEYSFIGFKQFWIRRVILVVLSLSRFKEFVSITGVMAGDSPFTSQLKLGWEQTGQDTKGPHSDGHWTRLPLGKVYRRTSKKFCAFLDFCFALFYCIFRAGELLRSSFVTCPLYSLTLWLPYTQYVFRSILTLIGLETQGPSDFHGRRGIVSSVQCW